MRQCKCIHTEKTRLLQKPPGESKQENRQVYRPPSKIEILSDKAFHKVTVATEKELAPAMTWVRRTITSYCFSQCSGLLLLSVGTRWIGYLLRCIAGDNVIFIIISIRTAESRLCVLQAASEVFPTEAGTVTRGRPRISLAAELCIL